MRVRLFGVVGFVLAVALAPVSASAGGGSITASTQSSYELTAGVLVTVPVSVVCADVPGLTPFQDQVNVSIEQANGKAISRGGAMVGGSIFGGSPLLLTCDGTTVNQLSISVQADPTGPPFKNGAAVASVSASRADGIVCGIFCVTNTQFFNASVGPMAVKLGR